MWNWVTFGELPDSMKDPLTYAMVGMIWASIFLLAWTLTPWFAFW